MDTKQPPPDIPAEDWAMTPASVRELVYTLLDTVGQLQQRVAALEEQLNQNSGNSSKPPSSDPPQARRYPPREASGRTPGGQPGHPGSGRKLRPPEQVTRFVVSKPLACDQCGALLLGEDPQPQRHQVCEAPRLEPEVIEYQRHTLACLACGWRNQAAWPAEMPPGSFGPRTQAVMAYLSGRFSVSQRDVQELLATLLRVEVSLGSVPAQGQRLSQALAQPVAEAQAYLRRQPAVNVDETGWHEAKDNTWLWVGGTPAVSVFQLSPTRGGDGVKALIGHDYPGIVTSDRWSAYNWLDPNQRQLCWAHLKRDFQALVERGGESATIGQLLLAQVKKLFTCWRQLGAGALSRAEFQRAMRPVRREVRALLELSTLLVDHRATRQTCHNILKLEHALWTFVDQEGVEPTNNAAERALRRGVIWRRRSYGTQSQTGSRFVARILTAVTTLRQQQRDVLDYLTEASQAHMLGTPAPSLLPKARSPDAPSLALTI